MTITVFPPRCAFSRRRTTRPNREGFATASGGRTGASGPAGRPSAERPAKGLESAAPDGERSSFDFPAIADQRLIHHRLGGTAKMIRFRTGADGHIFEKLPALKIPVGKTIEP